MRVALSLLAYEARNQLRGRAVPGYALFFALATWGLLTFAGGADRALPSLASAILLLVPLASLLVSIASLHDGRDFTELLLAHPVRRSSLLTGRFLGIAGSLALAYAAGVGLPLAALGVPAGLGGATLLLLGTGILLTAAFTALGFAVGVRVSEPARGLGAALLLWLAFTLVYDGVVLAAAQAFAAYPLERAMLVAMLLNPVDLARVATLVALDAAALAGYTGAVFGDAFGGASGPALVLGGLSLWIALPWAAALLRFLRMDL